MRRVPRVAGKAEPGRLSTTGLLTLTLPMADIPGQEGGKKIRCAVNGFGRVGRIVSRIAWRSDIIE